MTILAYPKRQFSTLNVLAVVIIIFIEFDDLTHLRKYVFMYKVGLLKHTLYKKGQIWFQFFYISCTIFMKILFHKIYPSVVCKLT